MTQDTISEVMRREWAAIDAVLQAERDCMNALWLQAAQPCGKMKQNATLKKAGDKQHKKNRRQ